MPPFFPPRFPTANITAHYKHGNTYPGFLDSLLNPIHVSINSLPHITKQIYHQHLPVNSDSITIGTHILQKGISTTQNSTATIINKTTRDMLVWNDTMISSNGVAAKAEADALAWFFCFCLATLFVVAVLALVLMILGKVRKGKGNEQAGGEESLMAFA